MLKCCSAHLVERYACSTHSNYRFELVRIQCSIVTSQRVPGHYSDRQQKVLSRQSRCFVTNSHHALQKYRFPESSCSPAVKMRIWMLAKQPYQIFNHSLQLHKARWNLLQYQWPAWDISVPRLMITINGERNICNIIKVIIYPQRAYLFKWALVVACKLVMCIIRTICNSKHIRQEQPDKMC